MKENSEKKDLCSFWKDCNKCFCTHPKYAPCLTFEQKKERLIFPCLWLGHYPYIDLGRDEKTLDAVREEMEKRKNHIYNW